MKEAPSEFYRLDELAREMKGVTVSEVLNTATAVGMIVSRLFKGKIIGCIGNIFDPSPYDRTAMLGRLETLSYQEPPFYVGYARLRKEEVIAAALRVDPDKEFATRGIINDSGEITLLLDENLYSNNDLFVLSDEVERVKDEYPDLFMSATQQQEPAKQITGEAAMAHMGLSSRKTQDGDQETLVGDYLNGMNDIKEFFNPITWKTITGWLKAYGCSEPAKGDIWRVKVSDANAIRSKKRSLIDNKLKNKK